jgi:hypothetical protein
MAQPIQLADAITPKLIRRFQASREISPLYLADARESGIDGNACDEAARVGLRSVTVGEHTYVRFGSEWYSWNLEVTA